MKFEEIEKYLCFNEQETNIYVPNEIFKDLQDNFKKTNHIPVAYSYYYLISWLYRYAKYGSFNIDNKKIKEILGYHQDSKGIDYIMKKNGVLDLMEYTITSKDYPLSWKYDKYDGYGLEFEMLSEFPEEIQKTLKELQSRKYTIKYPVKAFHRTKESEEDNYEDGTFYEVDNTHLVPFEVFMFCMSKKEIGCTGFYLWSYLKMQNQKFVNGYDVAMHQLAIDIGIPKMTMVDHLKALRQYNMVDVIHNQEYFCLLLDDSKRKANTYKTNEYITFNDSPQDYEKIKVVESREYIDLMKEEAERSRMKIQEGRIDISLDQLPF
ncbi:hypothetical protein H5P36_22690 [Bacillus sp. APMAM]|nr:hypothetical protein [Bacillus sp. APMAM]RTZ53592.1 hypothetical protein EKO25_22545 [Bacillus sp. SAJ1]